MNHQYKNLPPAEMEELFSNFLMDSWSFSKVASFARNEKYFEMVYVYRHPVKRSATEVAGSAYHDALKYYFSEKKEGRVQDIVSLQEVAYNYIDDIKPNQWKIQKTTPTVEDCKAKATKTAGVLIKNFFSDLSVYESEIKEILDVEVYIDEFVTINGVDIPLPCHLRIDLVIETIDGKVVIIDHKSKSSFTDEKELKFAIGKQAITYVIGYETKTSLAVHEVWFVENKTSENRDKSAQLNCFKVIIDTDTRRLYELMLYEPLKRMLEAISNPDYIYLINENDNFIDKAEMYEFWAMTMLADVEQFSIPENKRDLIKKRLRKVKDTSIANVDPKTIKKFRENAASFIQYDLTNKDMSIEEKIEHTLRTLGVLVKVAKKFDGFSSDTYLLEVSAATNIASVYKFSLDIASALNVSAIRMSKQLFVYEGKSYLAIESSKKREKNLLWEAGALNVPKIPLGIDNFGNSIFWNIANPSTPHMLVCGATGSGKSVSIISTIQYAKIAGFDEIVIMDPKFEFTNLASDKISVYNDIDDIETIMELQVEEMNGLVKSGKKKLTLIVFDEFADAVSAARSGNQLDVYEEQEVGNYKDGSPKYKRVKVRTKKSLEENLQILLQKGRSSGFRIIAATQRASVKTINGDAKVNFGVKICFRMQKEVDSKVVLDEAGAESLGGMGDGLISSPEYNGIVRFQQYYFNN